MQEIDEKEVERRQSLIKSVLEKVNEVGNVEDQLIKLYCLFNCCMANHTENGEEFISRRYIKEKLGRVMGSVPLILDQSAQLMYASIMLGTIKKLED